MFVYTSVMRKLFEKTLTANYFRQFLAHTANILTNAYLNCDFLPRRALENAKQNHLKVSILIRRPPGFSFLACGSSLVKKSSMKNLTCTTIHDHVNLQQINKEKQ